MSIAYALSQSCKAAVVSQPSDSLQHRVKHQISLRYAPLPKVSGRATLLDVLNNIPGGYQWISSFLGRVLEDQVAALSCKVGERQTKRQVGKYKDAKRDFNSVPGQPGMTRAGHIIRP